MQTAGLFFELPRPFRGGGKGAGLPRSFGLHATRCLSGCAGVPACFQGVSVPDHTLLVRVRRRPRLLSRRCCLQKTQGRRQEGDRRHKWQIPKSRLACGQFVTNGVPPSFTLRYPSSPNPPRQTPRYSRTHSRTYPADLPTSLSPYAATPAHYPSPAARA